MGVDGRLPAEARSLAYSIAFHLCEILACLSSNESPCTLEDRRDPARVLSHRWSELKTLILELEQAVSEMNAPLDVKQAVAEIKSSILTLTGDQESLRRHAYKLSYALLSALYLLYAW